MSSQRPLSPQVRNSQNYVWNRLDVLGHGATCEVFKAYHKSTGEPAAVKVFNKAGVSRDMYQQQVFISNIWIMYKSYVLKSFQQENKLIFLEFPMWAICLLHNLFHKFF